MSMTEKRIAELEKEFNSQYEGGYFEPDDMRECLAEIRRLKEFERDAARLDYVLKNSGFLMEEKLETGVMTYQLWSQDSDENYIYLSGEDKFFNSPRRAIDAAMQALEEMQ